MHRSSMYLRSVRNYRSPSRHWRLTFRVGDHQLVTWSQKKKKKSQAVANLSQRRRADREQAFFLPFFRFGLIENEKTDRETPTCHARARCCSAELCIRSRCFPHVRSQDREQRDKTTPCHNTQLESRFTFLTLLRRERRQTDPDIFSFRFGSIECETQIAKLSPVTCMRGATALCFQPLLFPRVWWKELKDTIGRFCKQNFGSTFGKVRVRFRPGRVGVLPKKSNRFFGSANRIFFFGSV